MMKHKTDVTVILDRSGSMEAIASDVIGGFNQFLTDQQRQPGECRLTLVQFDDQYEVVYLARPIADASRLTAKTFEPRGSTALLDAIGRTIDTTGARLAALPEEERPNRVLLVIITDGEENASVDYTRDRVFNMISSQQDVYGWSFLFLAANQDAIAEAATVGIAAQQSLNFAATGAGIRAASLAMSDAVIVVSLNRRGRARWQRTEEEEESPLSSRWCSRGANEARGGTHRTIEPARSQALAIRLKRNGRAGCRSPSVPLANRPLSYCCRAASSSSSTQSTSMVGASTRTDWPKPRIHCRNA